MKYVALPVDAHAACQSSTGLTDGVRRLSFYLAMEEYVARTVLPTFSQTGVQDDCFFLWEVAPSVIFGRNQVMQNEVNVDYCREHGIEMYRRKSGGGCVYADEGNLMLSYITREANVNFAFNRFVNMVLLVLRKTGIEGTGTSHNDILIDGKKVCGTACYQLHSTLGSSPERDGETVSIIHSTMLYDTNMQHMVNAITPSAEKLQKKGIESVRQRITLLKDYASLSLDELKTVIRETLCDDELQFTQQDVKAIERIEQEYLDREFIQRM
jgi:lipoic acid synthetase/lipoate-protein ligase A